MTMAKQEKGRRVLKHIYSVMRNGKEIMRTRFVEDAFALASKCPDGEVSIDTWVDEGEYITLESEAKSMVVMVK